MSGTDSILPGATLAMLGGGQLGRMFTIAARTAGYRVMVLDPDLDSPAGRIADVHLHASYTDQWALDELARECVAVTTEFENIPAATLERLAEHMPVRPGASALSTAQDRILEKSFIRQAGLTTVPYHAIRSAHDLEAAWAVIGADSILKRAAMGYDGKGQVGVDNLEMLRAAFAGLGGVPCVLERKVVLEREISVVLARSHRGESRCYTVSENVHRNGILHCSIVPARIDDALAAQAQAQSRQLADALDYCGVLAVEFFVVDGQLVVNEIAPRPHNSGHYSLDACVTSQFEQQLRMVCGLPFGDTHLLTPVVMMNLLGDLWGSTQPHWPALLNEPAAKLHLYGKRDARPGRKMGHFCVLAADAEDALARAEAVFGQLQG